MSTSRIQAAFFPMLPSSNAATRAFCERPLPYLRERGIESRVFPPSSSRLHRLFTRSGRLRLPLAALYWHGIVAPRRLVQLVRARHADVVFVQRSLFRWASPPVLERILRRIARGTIVYHCDDALYEVARPDYFSARCRLADWVVTGNDEIATRGRAANGRVFRLQGAVAVDRYPVRRHEQRSPIVIGWPGHHAEENLGPLAPALRRLARERAVLVRVASDAPFSAQGVPLAWERWRPEREFELFGDFDIGIMPLADTPYNRGKEAFKLKEFMAAGLPVVCSPVGHNLAVVEDGVTGFFAADDDEWLDRLVRLCDDVALRATLGAAGRKVAEDRFDVPAQADLLAAFLRRAAEEREPADGELAQQVSA